MSASEQTANIKFVKEVKKYPILYNFELPSYSRKDLNNEAWANVGRAMKMTPSECRERWRNLRAVFMRTMKAPPTSTGKKKPYYLSEVMQFVVPYMRPIARAEATKEKQRQLVKEREDHEEHEESQELKEIEQIKLEVPDDECYDSSEQNAEDERDKEMAVSKKRPAQDEEPYDAKVAKVAHESPIPPDNDHVKSFLNSLQPELTELNSAQFKTFKRRVLKLIDDIVTESDVLFRFTLPKEYIK